MKTWGLFGILAVALGMLLGYAATTSKLSPLLGGDDGNTAKQKQVPQKGAPPGSPGATTTIDGRYLPNPTPKFHGEINLNAHESKPYWPPRVVPPKGAPNVLLIMTDDVGFGAPSTFDGVIPTPALDRIAKMGLRYTNFHSTALCSPTRAALITGRNHHFVGFGQISEGAIGYPGYNSIINRDTATIGTILRDNGYGTSWFGKNHNTPEFVASAVGPFDQWPIGMGFEYFYGFVGGDTSQWEPNLFRNTTAIYPYVDKPGWNLTTAMADEAIDWMHQLNEIAPDKPFFCYYVPGGTHAPHHATPEWIKKISDMHLFDKGWNALREQIFANQKRLGVIPQDAKLTPWPKDLLKEWNRLDADQKKLFIRQADVYAAYLAYTDHEIGRVIQAVEDIGKLDDTLIIYISGDNGSSAEGSPIGTPNEVAQFNGIAFSVEQQLRQYYDVWGSSKTYNHMAVGWTWAFDTPFKWTKQMASHFGGTRQGMCMAWKGHIKDAGGIRHQFHHVIDIVPTILEATGIPAPVSVNGIDQKPIEGVSMAYTWDKASASAASKRRTQYFEMFGNRALYHDGWMAGIPHGDAQSILNRSFTITAEVEIPEKGAEGMLNTNGGQFGGYGLYLLKGKPVFTYNLADFVRFRWEDPETLSPGKHTITFDFTYEGPGVGKDGSGVLKVDGKEAASKTIPHTAAGTFQWDETFDVGSDTGTPVDDRDYQCPFRFTGKLNKLTVKLGPVQLAPPEKKKLQEKIGARD